MNKDIHKYITSCAVCKLEKVRIQLYPLQMRDMPDRPFDKIAIDLFSDLNVSTLGNQHILTIIDHLTGWPESFAIPNNKADMCPHLILSDNGTEFRNQLMDNVLKQPGTDHIFGAPYHLQSNRKLKVFHKYLKHTLKKMCEHDPDNWDKNINQVLAS